MKSHGMGPWALLPELMEREPLKYNPSNGTVHGSAFEVMLETVEGKNT